VFTFGARALVPGHRHKMVLCSDTGYPICWCQVQCPSTRSRPYTRARAPCPNSGVGTYLKKRCVRISAHQESFSGTMLGHQVWTQPKAVFTLGAQALVPGHRHKMVLCSDTGNPICWYVHIQQTKHVPTAFKHTKELWVRKPVVFG